MSFSQLFTVLLLLSIKHGYSDIHKVYCESIALSISKMMLHNFSNTTFISHSSYKNNNNVVWKSRSLICKSNSLELSSLFPKEKAGIILLVGSCPW